MTHIGVMEISNKVSHKYEYLGSGTDMISGWYKFNLRRDDGKEVKVAKARYRQLLREGRIIGR